MEFVSVILHPILGMVAIFLLFWAMILGFYQRDFLLQKKLLALVVLFLFLSWIVGGYFYINFYGEHKKIILHSSYAFIHKIFMESKEHIFLLVLIASFYLPFGVSEKEKRAPLKLEILLFLLLLFIEGSGALISNAYKIAIGATI